MRVYRAYGRHASGWMAVSESDSARRVDWAPDPQTWRPATGPERVWWELTRARFSVRWVVCVLAVDAILQLVVR